MLFLLLFVPSSFKALSTLVSLFLTVDSIGFDGVSIIFFFYKIKNIENHFKFMHRIRHSDIYFDYSLPGKLGISKTSY